MWKSTSGVIYRYGGAVVCSQGRKQQDNAQYLTEAKHISASSVAKEMMWLVPLVKEISVGEVGLERLIIKEQFIKLVKNPKFLKSSKLVGVKYSHILFVIFMETVFVLQ